MARLVLPLVLSLFACSASKTPEDPAADPGAVDAHDPAADDDDVDADDPDDGAGDAPDEGGGASDAGDGDSDPGDTGGAGDTGDAPESEDTSAGDPGPDGAELFATYCSACHGPEGQGTGAAPDITGDIDGESDAGLIELIQNGKDDMPGQDVTDEEAQAIVDWMRAGFGS